MPWFWEACSPFLSSSFFRLRPVMKAKETGWGWPDLIEECVLFNLTVVTTIRKTLLEKVTLKHSHPHLYQLTDGTTRCLLRMGRRRFMLWPSELLTLPTRPQRSAAGDMWKTELVRSGSLSVQMRKCLSPCYTFNSSLSSVLTPRLGICL